MSEPTFRARELFWAILHREPAEKEAEYWDIQLSEFPLASVIRRMTQYPEHKRFHNDARQMFVPAGHFYSPVVDQDFVSQRKDVLYAQAALSQDLEMNEQGQIAFLRDVKKTAASLPFNEEKTNGLRYYYENGAFLYGDAIVYATMLEKYRPNRIVEIGSGFSSALALDVRDRMSDYDPQIHFIDPFPQLAYELVGPDPKNVTVQEAFIQDVEPATFDYLEAGDFYFMDTTHIVKTGSDVLYHFEKVLPRLKSGVILHLHDIFFPFEYPQSWVLDSKLSWNELYYFRAFMVNNPQYEILFFNSFMRHTHLQKTLAASPLFGRNGGASIWFRKR